MKIRGTRTEAPERRGPHFAWGSIALGDAITERAHIVKEEI